ncbi:GntR family transcriptional regulator [Vineibacter terrae]|uniref:GntR family transcriptional regulator n=1 Tax=Vineibacter terrae TaxID=2586908 RepID=UPI002E36413D|nr:GntR family transcriptional regulator [Vineibacter terrae]HEX2887644.1 GntR family transcriptional regulator [Vineibacter terrae]
MSILSADSRDEATLTQRAYQLLREALLRGEFMPGQDISLRGAAEALNVSQMPARQALSRLQAEGVLVMRENRTLTVPELTPTTVVEVRDIRIALEGLAAELAALRATPQDIEAIAGHLKAMERSAQAHDIRQYIVDNWHFHMGVYRAAGSPMLLQMIEPLWVKYSAYTRLAGDEDTSATLPNHARALDGLRRRDPMLTRAGIVQDCCDTCEFLLSILSRRDGDPRESFAAKRNVGFTSQGSAFAKLVAPRRRGRPPKNGGTSR